jgi:hypothetical protein
MHPRIERGSKINTRLCIPSPGIFPVGAPRGVDNGSSVKCCRKAADLPGPAPQAPLGE